MEDHRKYTTGIMSNFFTVILIIAAAAFSIAAQSKLKTFPRPELNEDVTEFEKAACVALDSAAKICQGLTEEAAGGAKFIVWRGGEKIGEWDSAAFLGETADFRVFRADLDADGRDEMIVANRTSVSNGMGVNYWTIGVTPFPDGATKLNHVEFDVEDFIGAAAFVPRRKGGYDITATGWETLPVGKAGNRTALYFVGRLLAYRNGEFETSARPILIRRYLASFERERLKNIEDDLDSFFWLNSKAAEKRAVEPLSDLIVKSEVDAAIESVAFDAKASDDAVGYKIFTKTKSGDPLSLIYAGDADENFGKIDYIGDFARKRLYPKGYAPKNLTSGKTIKFITYADSKNEPILSRILWLIN